MDERLKQYRKYLVESDQKLSESYDKTIITLSSGALGISFAFIRDVVGEGALRATGVLFAGWALLAISLGSVVVSLFFATLAFRKAIKQVDTGSIDDESPGGFLGGLSTVLHLSGAAFLILGIFLVGVFAYLNL